MKQFEKAYNKKLKNISKAWRKRLKEHTANLGEIAESPLPYLVDSLRFLRDQLIMIGYETKSERNELSVTALVMAIEEYEQWESCAAEFLTVENTVQLIKEGKLEEASKVQKETQQKHWKKFWKLLELNMQEWFTWYVNI
jgi:hypothetical protein